MPLPRESHSLYDCMPSCLLSRRSAGQVKIQIQGGKAMAPQRITWDDPSLLANREIRNFLSNYSQSLWKEVVRNALLVGIRSLQEGEGGGGPPSPDQLRAIARRAESPTSGSGSSGNGKGGRQQRGGKRASKAPAEWRLGDDAHVGISGQPLEEEGRPVHHPAGASSERGLNQRCAHIGWR